MATTKTPTRKRASKKASTRKARAATSKAKSEAAKPREHVLPVELLEDAKDVDQLRRLRMEKVEDMIGHVRRLQQELHEDARAALVRLAKRMGLEIQGHEVVGLSEDCTRLLVMSQGEAKQRQQRASSEPQEAQS